MVTKTEEEFSDMGSNIIGDIYIGAAESYNMKYIAKVIKEIQENYPDIHYHLYSGNEEDVSELLDKGLIDFGILVDPADITKYDYLPLPESDIWGLIMKNYSPLAKKEHITKTDLLNLPLICSRQSLSDNKHNDIINWFWKDFKNINVVATFDLTYNASILVNKNIGYAIAFDNIVNRNDYTNLCFKPLNPEVKSKLNIVWKKQMIFSKPAQLLLNTLQKNFKGLA